ncbi:MAG: DUF3108 domain-containing protein [Bacteroidales bacterium]|nr:DUF3108 domain-containing protein [Bacteroidales bacterium]
MKNLIIPILFLIISINSVAQSNDFPFESGEKLTYSAHYHWGLFWMEAGEVIFQVDTENTQSGKILKMKSIGRTLPKYDWLFKVRDTFSSTAVYPEMKPLTFKRSNSEGKDWVRNSYVFDYTQNLLARDMESNVFARRIDTIVLPNVKLLDIQTAVYYARLWNLEKAKPGDQRLLQIMLVGEFFTIPMTYQGKEIVKHENGKRYRCHKITTEVVAGMIFKANQEISIYVSDDENQIPLVVKAPILIGKVEAYLQQSEKVNFPKEIIKD